MKKRVLQTISICLALLAVAGCRKNQSNFDPELPTLDDIETAILKQVPTSDGVSEFSISASTTDIILTTPSGIRLIFNDLPTLFTDEKGGAFSFSTCNGLKIRVTEASRRSEQFGQNMSATSDGKLLEPDGFVKVEITCDGQPLKIAAGRNFKINLPVASQIDQKQGLEIFSGATLAEKVVDWLPLGQQVFWADWQVGNSTVFGYELVAKQTGWFAAAKISSDAKTTFCITLPAHHNSQNTMVWLWLPAKNALVKMDGTAKSGQFCFGDAPHGFPVKIVVVSKYDGSFEYTFKETEVSNDGVISLDPLVFSDSEIVQNLRQF